MSTMSEITALEKKIDSHIGRQEKLNESMAENLKELTKAITDIRVYQAEVNRVSEDLRSVKDSVEKHGDRISAIEKSLATVDEIKPILSKVVTSLVTSSILVAASAVGYVIFNLKV